MKKTQTKKAPAKKPRVTASIGMSFLSFEEADGEEDVVEIEDGDGRRRVKLGSPSPPMEPEPQA